MYRNVYQDKYGTLIVRERSYTLTLFEEDYTESDAVPIPIERIKPGRTSDRLSNFVQDYVLNHPTTDLVARLAKTA